MRKRFLTFLLISAFAFCASVLALNNSRAVSGAHADTSLSATVINNNDQISFLHITDITAFCGGDDLYFSDGARLYRGADDIGAAADSVAFYDGRMLAAAGDKINYGDQTLATSANGAYSCIAVFGENLYAGSGNQIEIFAIDYNESADTFTLAHQKDIGLSGNVQDLCAGSSGVYFKLKNSPWVYTVTDSQESRQIESVTNLKSLAANPAEERFFCLTRDSVVSCKVDSDGLLDKKDLKIRHNGAERIAASADKIYLASSDEGAFGKAYSIAFADQSGGEITEFIAGRSDADYFYNSPSGVTSRFGGIYVADTDNNRVSHLSTDGITQITGYTADGTGGALTLFDRPKSTALSLSGVLYVAHKNKVTNTATGKTIELKDSAGRNLIIEKMLLDTAGNIFVLGIHNLTRDTFAYWSDPSLSQFSLLDIDNPSAMGYKVGGEVLFYNDAIKSPNGTKVADCNPLLDFCVDFSGKIFGINAAGNLVSISGTTETNHGGSYDKIAMSNVSNSFCGYGDLLLLETKTNSLKKIDAAAAGVSDVSTHFTVPNVDTDNTAHKKINEAVASVKYDAPLFSEATEAGINHTVKKDTDVFVRRDVDAPEDMYFVVAEDADSQSLKWGYIYRAALNSPYPYVLPPKNTARVIIDVGSFASIYKYPSLFSLPVAAVTKGDALKLLPFAHNRADQENAWYQDIGSTKWVRVDYAGGEGYIPQTGLSWSLFSGDNPQPNTNATIKDNAPLYVYNAATGEYEPLDSVSFLEKGKRVEVKTPFNSSSKYTQVIFSIETENGVEVIDIVCFVDTKNVNYDGVDMLQVVAIIAIIAGVILLILAVIWIVKKRKKRIYAE